MDYSRLADVLAQSMHTLGKAKFQKSISKASHGKMFMLRLLFCNKDDMSPGEIAEVMGISSARIAAVLNDIESEGLITRQINANDRRKILVKLTPKGEGFVETREAEMKSEVTTMLEKLGERDAKELVRIIGKLASMNQ